MVMAESALDKVPLQQMAQRLGRLAAASVEIVSIADRTHELARRDTEDGQELVRPPGMSEAEWNIHQDAMQPKQEMPGYLANHYERVHLVQKLAGSRPQELPPIAGYLVLTVEKKPYEIVNVETKEE
jgi:hypothetical protein